MRKMFSEKQIKTMVGESSTEIVSALQNQDLKVKTLEQSEANWNANDIFDDYTPSEGLTYKMAIILTSHR